MLWNLLVSLFSSLVDEPAALELEASPGLMTILDQALFRTVEGEITATICASHALLVAWLDLKKQARVVLQKMDLPPTSSNKLESFARMCLDAACEAIEKLSIDKLSSSANLTDPYEGSSNTTGTLSGQISLRSSLEDTGRRLPHMQRPRDCWETSRLICPDHVWSDDAYLTCQRLLRQLAKHLPSPPLRKRDPRSQDAELLMALVKHDLPLRLYQFRSALEADSVVTKRLYLVKSEYRAPFRAFLEAHQTLQKAPSLEVVERYIQRKAQKDGSKLQALLETPELLEALEIEQELESLEASMAQGLYGFTELARLLENRRAYIKHNQDLMDEDKLRALQDLLRRLKTCLCRKNGPETSSGIRPILLDLQGVARDDHETDGVVKSFDERVEEFIEELKLLRVLCKTPKSFSLEKRGEVDIPPSIAKDCINFDSELWGAECKDWWMLVQRQHKLAVNFPQLSEEIRRAEMEMKIAAASPQSLSVAKQRLEFFTRDRQRRFEVLKEMIEEVCLREMNLGVSLTAPPKTEPLELPSTQVLGLFGKRLQTAGEPLPLG